MVKVKVKMSLSMLWRHIGWIEGQFDPFLISAVDGSGWLTSRPVHFTPGKSSIAHLTGGWVGPRTSPPVFGEKRIVLPLPGFEPRTEKLVA